MGENKHSKVSQIFWVDFHGTGKSWENTNISNLWIS